eukprot:scaffold1727_cov133-Cylindrotheca_fusiformis.AAC.24
MIPGVAFVAFGALASLKWIKCGPSSVTPCLLVTDECIETTDDDLPQIRDLLQYVVIVDFGSRMARWKRQVKAYRDLSPTGNAEAAVRYVQSMLEWAHQVPDAVLILLPFDIHQESDPNGFVTAIEQRFRAETAGAEPIKSLLDYKVQVSTDDD